MRRTLAALAVLVASCGGTATTTTTTLPPPIPEDLLTVEVIEELGFSVSRPVDWVPEIELDAGVAAFYSPPIPGDPFTENFNIATIDVPAELTFELYVQADAQNLTQGTAVDVVESGETQVDGSRAATVRFRTVVDGVEIGFVRAITLRDGKAFEFTFAASEDEMDQWLPIVEQLINSIRFLN